MSEPSFRFRRFQVWHDRCAMKVGTDGVLLGAWAQIEGCRRLLDIGTGTGLVALMAAQRVPEARVVAVEVDAEATVQARENVARSPFADRIEVVQADIRNYTSTDSFDAILCNPPFFSEDTLPDHHGRALARHNFLLSFDALISSIMRLLALDGMFHVILPTTECSRFIASAFMNGLNVVRQCRVRTVPRKTPKRTLLSFSRVGALCTASEELVLQQPDGTRTPDYVRLTADFYL